MVEEVPQATNVMILEKDHLIRRALEKTLSDTLPPSVKIVVAEEDILCDLEKSKSFIRAHSPEYRALIGIHSGGRKNYAGIDDFEILKSLFETYEEHRILPRPILVTFQSPHFLKQSHGQNVLADENLCYFFQVPLRLRELLNVLKRGEVFSESKSADMAMILKTDADAQQHAVARDAVHSLKNEKAAARILMGAWLTGSIDKERMIKAFEQIGGNPSRIHGKSSCKMTNNTLQRSLTEAGMKILFVDDEYESAGWKAVMDSIMGNGNVFYASSMEGALKSISDNDRIRIVVLDLKLPSKQEEGIETLVEIKKVRPDIPVVMFTGEDTIKYQRKCFEKGCFDYFVKEFQEEEKDYEGYYETFQDIIRNALDYSLKAVLWRKVVLLEKRLTTEEKVLFEQGFHHLRKACYFLTDGGNDWRADLMLSKHGITPYAEVIIQCELAIEIFIRDNEHILSPEDRENNFKKIKALQRDGILDPATGRLWKQTREERNKYLHSDTDKRGIYVNHEDATRRLSEIINTFDKLFPRRIQGGQSKPSPDLS